MANFAVGFPELFDEGGGGQGQPLSGFGGNAAKDQSHHRAFIKESGKSPVVFVHGNTGTATHPQWGWLKVVDYLKKTMGYADEHFWALSYLGSGERQLEDPYTSNIADLRIFTDTVRSYLDVACLDMIGHSMGCHLILCYLAGLKKQATPIVWDQGDRYANVGTVVLIDGAMHGLRTISPTYDEWLPGHDVYNCLYPDNTPFGRSDEPTPAPVHNVRYWCCMVPGGYVDSMDLLQGTTGHLEGADENREYNSGYGIAGHEKVKDDPVVIADWAHFLNAVPPVDPVVITVDKESGNYSGELVITVSSIPPTALVDFTATRITKQIVVGALESNVAETLTGTLHHGQAVTLATSGMWEVLFDASGAIPVRRTYGVDAALPQVEIITDNSVDFENSLVVMAQADGGILYLNVGGDATHGWERRASVTITQNCLVQAIALTSEGLASDIDTKDFRKAKPWTEQAAGTVTEHYVAGRLDINGYLRYGSKYGYIQSFMLYRINGQWTDNPEINSQDRVAPVVACSLDSGDYNEPVTVKLSVIDDADPAPRVYYTTDNTTPTTSSAYFVNQGVLRFNTSGRKMLKYMARDRSGNTTAVETRQYGLEISGTQSVLSTDRPPGVYDRAIVVTISTASGDGAPLTVHYTLDGTVPDGDSPSFVGTRQFDLSTNGNHAISCLTRDSAGNECREIFYFVIRDNVPPVTTIFPNSGSFSASVEVSLNTEEPVAWIKYTTDGSDPSETNGNVYTEAFALTETTTVKYRSLDKQGNLEDVKSALFSRESTPRQVVFENLADVDGYIKANPDGSFRSVVDTMNLAIGAGWDGRISRSIVAFDTSSLPQTAVVTRAYLQVKCDYIMGTPWEGRQLQIDVKTGKFGSATICESSDWDETATAVAVATIVPFTQGNQDSSDFNAAGRKAINRSGRTQMRLYFAPHTDMGLYNYLFLTKGRDVKLIVEYMVS